MSCHAQVMVIRCWHIAGHFQRSLDDRYRPCIWWEAAGEAGRQAGIVPIKDAHGDRLVIRKGKRPRDRIGKAFNFMQQQQGCNDFLAAPASLRSDSVIARLLVSLASP